MDVTPRTGAPDDLDTTGRVRSTRSKTRGLVVALVLVAVVGGVGFLLIKQVGSASLYYYNADEAVAKQEQLGTRRFRVQGTYIGSKAEQSNGDVVFTIAFNGANVKVDHSGSQPALFKPGIPVVLDGRWADDDSVFLSDRIEVKHSEVYSADNPDRVDPAAP